MKCLLLTLSMFSVSIAWSGIESSPDIFLPMEQKEFVQAYQKAPISWWNFLIYHDQKVTKEQACKELQQKTVGFLLYDPCRPIPVEEAWLQELANSQILQQSPPTSIKQLQNSLDQTVVKLSLPLPSSTLNLIRRSPLASFENLGESFSNFFSAPEKDSKFKILPFLIRFSPESKESEDWVLKALSTPLADTYWAGPHIGAQVNKQQVIHDLTWVASFGSLLVLVLIGFLILTGRSFYLLLIPIVGVSLAGTMIVVHSFWGSIHGLTLAFGSGLVGISMDYAFHGWSEPHNRKVWQTNTISFLTTMISFSLLLFFSAPLIRQISLFSMVGLSLSFSLCFLASKHLKILYQNPIEIPIRSLPRWLALLIVAAVVAGTILSLPSLKLDFSIKRMDLAHNQMRSVLKNSQLNNRNDRMGFYLANDNDELHVVNQWVEQQKIPVLNSLTLLGTDSQEKYNVWKTWACKNNDELVALANRPPYNKLFPDFFGQILCNNWQQNQQSTKTTSSLFRVGDSSLSIFKIDSEHNFKLVAERFPKTFFLSQLTHDFPETLKRQSLFFLIACFAATLIFLLWFFGTASFFVFVPVLGALSGILLVTFFLGRPMTFISFVSLIILLGLTLDYGVFCTAYSKNKDKLRSVFGSIGLSASTSLAGFAPLAFCGHPVLADLGITIVSGLTGALLFTYLVFPNLLPGKKEFHV